MQQALICPSCRCTVEPGLHGMRLNCAHWVHAKCLDRKAPDFDRCAACKGEVDLNVPHFDENEPDAVDGRDYVQKPLADSIFTPFMKKKTGEPFKWIAEKSPLSWIIRDKGYGLQRMLAAGVRFDDFLNAGYTWTDLKAFKDFGRPDRVERAREALFALKCNAEHLRDYPHLMMGAMVSELKIDGRHLVEMYGLHFPENSCKPLTVAGGTGEASSAGARPWQASDLVKLGFKMRDLYGAGLQYVEQYALLNPTDADEIALEVSDHDISELPSLTELERQKREAVAAARSGRGGTADESAPPPPRRRYIEIPEVNVVVDMPKRVHGLKKK